MNLSNIKQINDQIYDSILLASKQNQSKESSVDSFAIIKYLTESSLLNIFESVFDPLSQFVQSVNKEHPDVQSFLLQVCTERFFDKAHQILKLIDYCDLHQLTIKEDFVHFQKYLNDLLNQSMHSLIGDPEKTKIFTRFLPTKKRWLARTFKKTQTITCKKNDCISILDNHGLQAFYHNSNLLLNIKNDLLCKKDNMYGMGCTQICKEIETNIKEIEEFFSLQKYGFHRITISKIIKLLNVEKNSVQFHIRPVTHTAVVSSTNAARFVDLCDNFSFGDQGAWPIFDHYAEICCKNSEFSILVGEIDTKSYFICYNFEEK